MTIRLMAQPYLLPSLTPSTLFQLENQGLRELLGISREAFLVLKMDESSESTSLSALLTSADVSLRKS